MCIRDSLKEGENGKQAINWEMPIDMNWNTGGSATEEGSQLESMLSLIHI